jgi:hypothetical protein
MVQLCIGNVISVITPLLLVLGGTYNEDVDSQVGVSSMVKGWTKDFSSYYMPNYVGITLQPELVNFVFKRRYEMAIFTSKTVLFHFERVSLKF